MRRCIARLVHKADFQRLLASPVASRSAHFAAHHLRDCPQQARLDVTPTGPKELSTGDELVRNRPVNNFPREHWLGTVLPKRLARRAVTRNLMRRQIRAVLQEQAPRLPTGLWLVRLRAPLALTIFPSAASAALRAEVRGELTELFDRLAHA